MITRNSEPCELLEWDSEFFGFQIARVCGDLLTPERVRRVDAWCCQARVRCLYFLSRFDSFITTKTAAKNGFQLVDVRMTLKCSITDSRGVIDSNPDFAGVIRHARLQDVELLQSIARGIYYDSRFYFDKNFPRHLCDLLYETWIQRSVEGYEDAVLVAELDSEPVGYVTCDLKDETAISQIGLIGVAEKARGQGVGRALVCGAIEWCYKQGCADILVVTQGRNHTAQRLYQRCGFLTESAQLWYHKWYYTGLGG